MALLRSVVLALAGIVLASLAHSETLYAGVYQGPGYYVSVYSSYSVSGSMAQGYKSKTYHGAIEGPFPTEDTCNTRFKEVERAYQKIYDSRSGYAFFMCYRLSEPMEDGDSGIWWNPQNPAQ